MDAAKSLYNSINAIDDLNRLIEEGEAESLFLECKSPEAPVLNRDLKHKLSVAVSGFSNTNGGIIIWGISTTKKKDSGLDVLAQIELLGSCKKFSTEISNKIPTLSVPSITNCENKIIKQKENDTKGVILTYIPHLESDPIQSIDGYFYFRSGDEFIKTPYQMLKRLFASSDSPNLSIFISGNLVKKEPNSFWKIPIVIANLSSAIGEHIKVTITIENPKSCLEINASNIRDISNVNPGNKVFSAELNGVVHKGFDTILGDLKIKMKGKKSKIVLKINIFANKMRAKSQVIVVKLYKNKFTTELIKDTNLY